MDVLVAVDPDLVDDPAQGVGGVQGLPLGGGRLGVVEDLPQAQDYARGGAGLAQAVQRGAQLAAHPVQVPVDDDERGGEVGQGGRDEGGAQRRQRLGRVPQAPGAVADGALGEARQDEPVESRGQEEVSGGRQAGDQQAGDARSGQARQVVGELMGEREIAAQVPEPERVMAVEHDAGGVLTHCASPFPGLWNQDRRGPGDGHETMMREFSGTSAGAGRAGSPVPTRGSPGCTGPARAVAVRVGTVDVHVSASWAPGDLRRGPRARHLTREHVCQRYVLAG